MRQDSDAPDGLLSRLFGAAFDECGWRVEVANENETQLVGPDRR